VKNTFYYLIFGLLLLAICPADLLSQDEVKVTNPGLTASLDQESAKLGAIVLLTLRYSLPEGACLTDKPEISGLEGLTILGLEIGPEQIKVKLLVDKIDSWKTGPLSLAYVDKDENTEFLTTDPVSIRVLSNLGEKAEEAQLRPIQGIIPTRAWLLKYLPWGAGLLGIVLVGAGLFIWRKKRHIRKVSAELLEPPHVRARKEIEQLEAQGLFEKGHTKAFYFRFSEILRQYLESVRGFPAAEFTTEEIASRIDNEQDRTLLPLLRQADLVKFADSKPTPARKEEEVRAALSYIQKTALVVEPGYAANGPKELASKGVAQ
jgi:hypothetical protein